MNLTRRVLAFLGGGVSAVASVGEDGELSTVVSRVRFLVMTVPVEVSEDDVDDSRFMLLSKDLRLTCWEGLRSLFEKEGRTVVEKEEEELLRLSKKAVLVTAFAFGVGSFCNANLKGACCVVVDDDDDEGVVMAVSPIFGLDTGDGDGVGDLDGAWLSVRKKKRVSSMSLVNHTPP